MNLQGFEEMPGLAHTNEQFTNAISYFSASSTCSNKSVSSHGFWSKHDNNINYNQLQKFWSELPPQARRELLRIDKQTLFEQARKNMYCSRCNGLLLEGFLQIVIYGKSLHQEAAVGHISCNSPGVPKSSSDRVSNVTNDCQDETHDPSVHPWGGLTTTRDGTLTLLDCYLYSKSLKGLQNVFDSARARERERELLYPDACGGGGRGWISQGMASYGRGHGTRETCALHTARLSCDTLVDFWSALGEETRQSLLKMKEEDFIERLMFRFDNKRFCRDCRRNVIREFKELKELKRMHIEPHCTSWFCVADTAFQYEVSDDTVQADWCQTFADTVGSYHHFEWAVGTAEGNSDIMEFENVGMNGSGQVNGLELGGLSACYITLRAWKLDGRCTELSVKAHALKGQQCVHCRLVVGDGFVAITKGESIRRFFEHAEEAEEEEDDDSMDKDGNDFDGECSRPQKHAKSPELAREFLLDAATVIFKEQVEKAFREGTARQNAHSIFVCLALKLLEERVHVACKEIVTLEKQMKLLEEEEKEKREEEERKERRRAKEREKKLRRKERLKGKERDRKNHCLESNENPIVSDIKNGELASETSENMISSNNSVGDTANVIVSRPQSLGVQETQLSHEHVCSEMQNHSDGESTISNDGNGLFMVEQSKFSRRRSKYRREFQSDTSSKWSNRHQFVDCSESGFLANKPEPSFRGEKYEAPSKSVNGLARQLRVNSLKSNARNAGLKFGEKFQCSNNGINDRHMLHSCSCNQPSDYRAKAEPYVTVTRLDWEAKSVSRSESVLDMSKQFYQGNKFNQPEYIRCSRSKSKINNMGSNISSRDFLRTKKVWEPMEPKKYPRSNSDSDVTLRSSEFKIGVEPVDTLPISSDTSFSNLDEIDRDDQNSKESRISSKGMDRRHHTADEEVGLYPMRNSCLSVTSDPNMSSSSNSDNCSTCLSEGDNNTASSNSADKESLSASDSEDANHQSEEKETPRCARNSHECTGLVKQQTTNEEEAVSEFLPAGAASKSMGGLRTKSAHCPDTVISAVSMGAHHQGKLLPTHNRNVQFPVVQAPSRIGTFYHQNPVTWPAAPANGLMPFPPHPNHYLFASPFGYGMNGSSPFCMQYGAVQHLTTPLFNPGQVPAYHPVANAAAGEAQSGPNGASLARVVPEGLRPKEALRSGETEQKGNSDKEQMGNNGFSLFHFGGPVALSNGQKSDYVHSKEEAAGDFSAKPLEDCDDSEHACTKKESAIEEYNLFASSNGIRFSFF